MHECPIVETERLVLRPFRDDDVDAYFAVHDTREVRASLHLPDSFDREEAWKHLALWNGQWTLRRSGQWAVELKATGELIGRAGTHRPLRAGWPGLEVGWTMHPAHWGNGYATEAARALVDLFFKTGNQDELLFSVLSINEGSRRVIEKCGGRFWKQDTNYSSFLKKEMKVDHFQITRENWMGAVAA